MKRFNELEQSEILEIARLALEDDTFFEYIGDNCDLSSSYLEGLRKKVRAACLEDCG